MKENSVLYEDYPEDWNVSIPAKWIFVAEDMLNEDQYKEWLFYTMRYLGVCGMWTSDDAYVNMLLDAVYDEDEEFFDKYWNSLLKNRQKKTPLDQQLKVGRVYSKEEQLDAYLNRQRD